MTTPTLTDPRVETVLQRLFRAAESDEPRLRAYARNRAELTLRERVDAAADIYMSVAEAGGILLYQLVRAIQPRTVIEYGMSYGISTLFLASAVRDNRAGHVFTTELSVDKIAAARGTFADAGLDDLITILEGDARETLATLDKAPDFVYLDGFPELYVTVLKTLEPALRPGTLIVADDVPHDGLAQYLDYIREPANGYLSMRCPIDNGIEISCRV
jgi:predicted O-methyltransferase YrrM